MPSSPLPSQQEGWRTEFHLGALPLGFPSNLLPPPPLRKQERFSPAFPGRVCSCNLQTRALSYSLHSSNGRKLRPARVSHQASPPGLGKPVPAGN